MSQSLRIATRKSPLAIRQTEIFATQLKKIWPSIEIELVPMTTQGDELLNQKLQNFGGKGLFVKELENALLENRADIAVHSMKDVPAHLPKGLILGCICTRDDPYDVLVSTQNINLDSLPLHAKIGTASLRRQAQLLAYRPDLKIETLRGNINTRIQKLQNHQFDAIILAAAGLERMQFLIPTEKLSTDIMLPACGQGAVGIECRQHDTKTLNLIAPLHHHPTAICVKTEREVNALLGGHCHVPIAIFAQLNPKDKIELRAKVLNASGSEMISFHAEDNCSNAMNLAHRCATDLLNKGAQKLIQTA
jgi:hydroxymethylbilane synthase